MQSLRVFAKSAWLLSLIFLTNAAISLSGQADSTFGRSVFARISPYVFQIKTSVSANAPKRSYGSGFVVAKDGHLITNYHVVADVVQDPKKRFQAYLIVEGEPVEAKIVDFDVLNDLALIKVDREFSSALKINASGARQGETIYSIGLPRDLNISIIEGKYNGTVFKGFNEQIHMSSPLNQGMSGGPTLNERGEVIGVNVSILRRSQNISFGIPIQYAIPMIEKTRDKQPVTPVESLQQASTITARQIKSATDGLLQELEQVSGKTRRFANWQVLQKPRGMKCWSSKSDIKKDIYEHFFENCDIDPIALINSNHTSAFYQVDYGSARNKKLSNLQFYNYLDRAFRNKVYMPDIYTGSNYSDRFYTGYNCRNGFVENSHKVGFKYKFCIVGYLFYPGLYEVNYNAISIHDSDDVIQMIISAYGFTREGVQRLIEIHLEKIQKID